MSETPLSLANSEIRKNYALQDDDDLESKKFIIKLFRC